MSIVSELAPWMRYVPSAFRVKVPGAPPADPRLPAYVPVGNPVGGGTGEGSAVVVGVDAVCAIAAADVAAGAVVLLALPHAGAPSAPELAQMSRIRRLLIDWLSFLAPGE